MYSGRRSERPWHHRAQHGAGAHTTATARAATDCASATSSRGGGSGSPVRGATAQTIVCSLVVRLRHCAARRLRQPLLHLLQRQAVERCAMLFGVGTDAKY